MSFPSAVSRCGWLCGVPSITAAELFSSDGTAPADVLLVDVRSVDEQLVSRIPGARAGTFVADQLAASKHFHRGGRIVVYCTAGLRSLWFCLVHRRRSNQLLNLVDGIVGYCNLTDHPSLETPDGERTRSVHVYSLIWNSVNPAAGYTVTVTGHCK
jgi:hypothetical protein